MDRGPEAAPAHGAPGLLPRISRASDRVLLDVGGPVIGMHPGQLVPLPAAEQNDDMGDADGREPDEAAAAVGHQVVSSEKGQHGNKVDGNNQHYHHNNANHAQIAGEAEDSNENQAAAVADDQDATGAAGGSEATVDTHGTCAIQDLENDKALAGAGQGDQDDGKDGDELGEVVVAVGEGQPGGGVMDTDDNDCRANRSSSSSSRMINNDNQDNLAGEAKGDGGAQIEAHQTDTIQDLDNDQSAAGTLRVGQNEGEGGDKWRRVVVAVDNDDNDGGASRAAEGVIEHDGGEGLAAVVVEGNVADGGIAGVLNDDDSDERAGGASAEVPAEMRFPVMDSVLEVVRHRILRALLLLMSTFSGALVVLLMLWAVSGNLINVGQGQAVLLQFGGGGIISALNDFSNDNTITGLRFTGVIATEGKQRHKVKFDVKLDKIDSRSTTSSDGGTWGIIKWPTFGGGKEGAGDKDATVVASTKKKKGGDVEPKCKGFGREVGRLDATKDDRSKRLGRESRGQNQGVGDNDDEYFFASGGSIVSRVKRLLDTIGSWLRKDMPQADYIFAEGWID